MRILVFNCGSSSLKADLIDSQSGARIASERIGRLQPGQHAAAITEAIEKLVAASGDVAIEAVGHRVVHGGTQFVRPTRIDDEVVAALEGLIDLAPLHNPANIAGIRAARRQLPDCPHVAVFDTAFHATLPRRARSYAIPQALSEKHGIRRYGFHGTSHAWVAKRAAEHLRADLRELRLITCHLGNGCSVAAVEMGRCVETSMGMTPLEGLVMGTRSGDIDAGVLLQLMRAEGLDADGLDALLNAQSGLLGLSGVTNDMRDIEARAAEGDEGARLAIQVFAHRVRKYIGAYAAVMGGVDAIVFTGGIGENSALIRHRASQRLEFLGAVVSEERNREARVERGGPVVEVSESHSRCRLLVVATDEALAIARKTRDRVRDWDSVQGERSVPVAVSNRHVHLTQEAVNALFGEGHTLRPRTPLSQPGQFAAEEAVTLVGPKARLEGVRVVGPTRGRCQVEIARTDEFRLGIDAPVRRSGDLDNTPGITLEGPAGRYVMDSGVICSQRHIHMTPEDAEHFGVQHKDVVEVALDTDGRDLIFGDVVVRVSPSYKLEMHLDTDEGNAAEIGRRGEIGTLLTTNSSVTLRRKR